MLYNALRDGILGFEYIYDRQAHHTDFMKEKWKEGIKKNKKGVVHFNIMGRSRYYGNKTIKDINESYYGPGGIGVVFDLNKFQEVDEETFCDKNSTERINTYRAVVLKHNPEERFEYRNSKNRFNPTSELGFTLSHRIAPRFFQGLVINEESPAVLEYLPSEYDDIPFKNIPKEIIAENTEIALNALGVNSMKMAYHDKPQLFLPIYDAHGNLLWPKQMSYEEVKKLVAERDAKNTNKEEK